MQQSTTPQRALLSGNEAVAQGLLEAGIQLGTGYPGTPSTEILENFSLIGGKAQWAPNEKVALEVAIGAAYGGGRAACTMKHVGLNVAADPLFTAAYTGVTGGLVIIVADDPGMASSQNEQDSRRYAVAAALPMLEPADSQQAYDFAQDAILLSEHFNIPVFLRMTTRICHSKTLVESRKLVTEAAPPRYERSVQGRVMIPAFARPAHKKLREKLEQMGQWAAENLPLCIEHKGPQADGSLGIVAAGISVQHAREAAPEAVVLQIGFSHPLPIEQIRQFSSRFERCLVVEEGDPVMVETLRAEGVPVEGKDQMFRFGELNVDRVRRMIARDTRPEPAPTPGKPPALCKSCPHRSGFEVLRDMGCIVTGDIGCYTLGVLPPFNAMDTCVCMGASIGVGLGLRHVLPEAEARKVVSVIGDSTFMHSGLTGLAEMVYNPPPTGHVVMILDNSTTAMTGLQEHPGTGRALDHSAANRIDYEMVAKGLGIDRVFIIDAVADRDRLVSTLEESLASNELTLIITRRPCILAAGKIRQYDKENAEKCSAAAVE